jgi:hypothetical protein
MVLGAKLGQCSLAAAMLGMTAGLLTSALPSRATLRPAAPLPLQLAEQLCCMVAPGSARFLPVDPPASGTTRPPEPIADHLPPVDRVAADMGKIDPVGGDSPTAEIAPTPMERLREGASAARNNDRVATLENQLRQRDAEIAQLRGATRAPASTIDPGAAAGCSAARLGAAWTHRGAGGRGAAKPGRKPGT